MIQRPPDGAPKPVPPLHLVFAATAISRDESRWLLDAADGLQARGHRVEVATPAGTALDAEAAQRALTTRVLRTGWRLDPRVGRSARAALAAPDAVIALDPAAWAWARRAAPPLLFARIEDGSQWVPEHVAAHAAAVLIPAGTQAAAWVQHAGAVRRAGTAAVRVIADAAPAARITAEDVAALRRRLRLPRRVQLVLYLAPLVAGNRHDDLLQALARLVPRGATPRSPSPLVALLGTGPEEARLRVLSQDLGVKEQVLWLGARKEVGDYLRAVDAVLISPAVRAPRHLAVDARAQGIATIVVEDEDWDVALARLVARPPAAVLAHPPHVLAAPAPALGAAATNGDSPPAETSRDSLAADLECAVYAAALRRRAPTAAKAALFLDRDGTLVRDVPYNGDPGAVVLEPHVGRALRWARDAGFALVVISNQSGVGRGLIRAQDVEEVHERIRAALQQEGADLDALYFCPHTPEDACACRKPKPGLVQRAVAEHGFDLQRSFLIGDAPRDIEAARAAGVRARAYRGAAAPVRDWPADVPVYDDWLALVRDVLAVAWAESQ